ncbi:MAG: zinc ABC transporter substrate-binding protein [Deltaproteobacteria bacterium]|nr:zinc ABC transporter substrate-binding protein [Deltaproteobacteria bacterium]
MKKFILLLMLAIFPLSANAKVNIVTTTTDLAAIAREVGGELVSVESICRGDQDPHYLEPKPSYVVKMNRADLFVEVGLDLEIGWLPVLMTQSRNPKIQRGSTGYLDASRDIPVIEIPAGKVDRSMGDIHPLGNPHYWLDPRNGLIIAREVADKLSVLDPANQPAYRDNLATFESRLKSRIAAWQSLAASLRGKDIVTHHKVFSYFANWLGITIADVIEPKPGIPAPPSHITSLIDLIKSRQIHLIVSENYYDPKPSWELGKKTGAVVRDLATSVGGETGVTTYEGLFDYLIGELKGAL